ncbi:type VI secretion system protein TssA [Burkholderia cepacia]|uniref:type VI secretion system protein TssA n=1 Tax=Burkholderia cepacia TaxID=292 RepID=UPI000759B14F|nr:type VI secretion system protein TssA [Burkholderia cepacia]KVF18580.1 ImpA domain-containing protein [Burkholderia cepacia]KWC86836.1 ImpA domain-containing protein [Burkholderia cepacia]MCA7904950.1 type VI secretion system protein TssA [Burkholderia cepacia]MDN7910269.1 type VI secretion system protein TssA [Burkholderia cepacia]UIY55305.1 type VI secretion system protein TssA [Burkholderia cepacia]
MSLVKLLAPLDLDTLLAPIDPRQPAGVFDEEDDAYQGIDHEMVKLGSLQEATIDWPYVDEAAQHYLCSQCKHLRIAGHLLTARARTRSWRGWAEATGVLAGMVERYWETSYPKPGATGYLAKRRLVGQLLERLSDSLAALENTGYGEEFYKAGQAALDSLQRSAESAQLDVPTLSRIEGLLRQKAEALRAPELAGAKLDTPVRGDVLSDAFFTPALPTPGNEREGRKSLLAAAEIINQQDPYDPTGYLLRRFALWAHLTNAPSARKHHQTELMAVPADVAEGYAEALIANAVDPALLQRVERSVTTSPYWLRGSYLAAGIARRLEMPLVAEAIRQATERFVTRLPALGKLEFADGRPFVDGETQAWISGAQASGATSAAGHDYAAVRDELHSLLEAQGVESVLRRLETIQQEATDLRHRCHVMAIAAELLQPRGLTWLADGLFVRAYQSMQNASAPEWEPNLFSLLQRHQPDASGHKD